MAETGEPPTDPSSQVLSGEYVTRRLIEVRSAKKIKSPGPTHWIERGQVVSLGNMFTAAYWTTSSRSPPRPSKSVGDIWIDILGKRVYYVNALTQWTVWYGNSDLVFHPIIGGYQLIWHPKRKGIAWVPLSTANRQKRNEPQTFMLTISELLSGDYPFILNPPEVLAGHHSSNANAAEGQDVHMDDDITHYPATDEKMAVDRTASPTMPTTVLTSNGTADDNTSQLSLELDALSPSTIPTYSKNWTRQSCLSGRGSEFPDDAPVIIWWNRLRTCLPFVASQAGISASEDEDAYAVQCMLDHGVDATACMPGETEPPVNVLDPPDLNDWSAAESFQKEIRSSLARGRPVLVRNWNGFEGKPAFKWGNEACYNFEFRSADRNIQWEDALLRAKNKADLLQRSQPGPPSSSYTSHSPPNAVASTISGDKFWFTESTPLQLTSHRLHDPPGSSNHHIGPLSVFLKLLDTPSFSGSACISDHHNIPWVISSLNDHQRLADLDRHEGEYTEGEARHNSSTDFVRAQKEWKQLTSAGFLGLPRHDPGGLASYTAMKAGLKLWGFFRPKADKPGVDGARQRLLATDAILSLSNFEEQADLFLLMLTPGSLLIQPPGLLYIDYSPIKNLCDGGYFLAVETLHLTAWSRRIESIAGSYSTCGEHPLAILERTLARMMLSFGHSAQKGRSCT
ncbi:hypothetical protein HGRIS_009918 [Hohenbuehelia grisea]|uniref:Uncharacterized protein n=1 Tax=Hohenbuehelia grisea TaxID=104357 RepID=A0ABR3J310_9AGAR